MNNIVLNFEGPFGLTKNNEKILFQKAISKKSGIYLWAIPYNNGGLLINYIGETSKRKFRRKFKEI